MKLMKNISQQLNKITHIGKIKYNQMLLKTVWWDAEYQTVYSEDIHSHS